MTFMCAGLLPARSQDDECSQGACRGALRRPFQQALLPRPLQLHRKVWSSTSQTACGIAFWGRRIQLHAYTLPLIRLRQVNEPHFGVPPMQWPSGGNGLGGQGSCCHRPEAGWRHQPSSIRCAACSLHNCCRLTEVTHSHVQRSSITRGSPASFALPAASSRDITESCCEMQLTLLPTHALESAALWHPYPLS